jgi:hypothetical protein
MYRQITVTTDQISQKSQQKHPSTVGEKNWQKPPSTLNPQPL